MYKCKKCHQALTKFDKDICPYCGTVRPLEGQSDETQDVTQIIEAENIKKDFIDYKPKKLLVYAFLLGFLGIFAAHLLYLKMYVKATFLFLSNIFFIGAGGYLLSLLNIEEFSSMYYLYWVIAAAVLFAIYLIVAITVFLKKNVLDKDGQVLK